MRCRIFRAKPICLRTLLIHLLSKMSYVWFEFLQKIQELDNAADGPSYGTLCSIQYLEFEQYGLYFNFPSLTL